MTTYEALSLLVQFSISLTAGITLIVTIVVFLYKKK
ncbi:putative holin-like toxin [Oceanobacillus limi]|nr:putative holin-like toxin [Oceanobacillus limi]